MEMLEPGGLAIALQPQLPLLMKLKLWHLFFSSSAGYTVPPGSAAACLEEHPASTEQQKLTRTLELVVVMLGADQGEYLLSNSKQRKLQVDPACRECGVGGHSETWEQGDTGMLV